MNEYFFAQKIIGAICHGVVLAVRSKTKDSQSVLHGKKSTAFLTTQEISGWALNFLWLGNYVRTYPQTVEKEVRAVLRDKKDFLSGPISLRRDKPMNLKNGFIVHDENYFSARWPGDAHLFRTEYLASLLAKNK